MKFSLPLATRHKKNLPLTKNICGEGERGSITMENKDANTDYPKFGSLCNQKWEIVEITIGIIFFAWDSYSLFLIQGIFKSHLKKITPNWSANSQPWFDLSPFYINILKNSSTPHPPWPKEGSGGCKLCLPRPSDLDFLWLVSEKMCVVLMFLLARLLNALINWNWLEHPSYLIMWVISSPSDL